MNCRNIYFNMYSKINLNKKYSSIFNLNNFPVIYRFSIQLQNYPKHHCYCHIYVADTF